MADEDEREEEYDELCDTSAFYGMPAPKPNNPNPTDGLGCLIALVIGVIVMAGMICMTIAPAWF